LATRSKGGISPKEISIILTPFPSGCTLEKRLRGSTGKSSETQGELLFALLFVCESLTLLLFCHHRSPFALVSRTFSPPRVGRCNRNIVSFLFLFPRQMFASIPSDSHQLTWKMNDKCLHRSSSGRCFKPFS